MRDLLNIRQTHDVLEYANRFEQGKHRVLVHNRDLDEVFFVQKFMSGLNYNISNAITLHKPRTVDAALSLAIMQEELVEASSKRYNTRGSRDFQRAQPRSHQTAPVGLLGQDPPATSPDPKTISNIDTSPRWYSKLSALQAQRRKMGLCMKCGKNGAEATNVPLRFYYMFWRNSGMLFRANNLQERNQTVAAVMKSS